MTSSADPATVPLADRELLWVGSRAHSSPWDTAADASWEAGRPHVLPGAQVTLATTNCIYSTQRCVHRNSPEKDFEPRSVIFYLMRERVTIRHNVPRNQLKSLWRGTVEWRFLQKTLVSGAWGHHNSLKCLQIQHFFEERYRGERDFLPILWFYFCCRHTLCCCFCSLKGTEAVNIPEHKVQPEPSLWRTFQVGLSRLTTTVLFQYVPSTARISLCLPTKHSVVPLVAWFVELTHSYHSGKAVMLPRSPFCASVYTTNPILHGQEVYGVIQILLVMVMRTWALFGTVGWGCLLAISWKRQEWTCMFEMQHVAIALRQTELPPLKIKENLFYFRDMWWCPQKTNRFWQVEAGFSLASWK